MRPGLIDARPEDKAQRSSPRPAPYPQRGTSPAPGRPRQSVHISQPGKRRKALTLVPAEGWLPLFLLAIAVYSVVYSVTAAITISHTEVLWMTTALGLICGRIVSKSRYFPQTILHIAACIAGYWGALFVTSQFAYHVPMLTILANLRTVIFNGFTLASAPENDMIFLFYLAFLCFFLGYFGSWLVYRAHLPWLVALVYVSILIVNLNYIARRDLTLLVVILIAALIPLIARVQLAGQLAQWRNEGLYTDKQWLRSLNSRFLRVVLLFTVLILPLSLVLPVLSQPPSGVVLWNNLDNAWANLSHGNLAALTNPNSLFSPYQPATNFFGDQLAITGSVSLPDGHVLSYNSGSATAGQYLEGFTFNKFDGHTWTTEFQNVVNIASNNAINSNNLGDANAGTLTTTITMVQPPDGLKHYIFAPPDPAQFTVPITIYTDPSNAFISSWTQTNAMAPGEQYQVVSNTIAATAHELNSVPLPGNDPGFWSNSPAFPALHQYYLQTPDTLSKEVLTTALTWTQGANTTYELAEDLQSHLSNQTEFTYSLTNPAIPDNEDAVTWLLHMHKGYCTHFATAMVIMARLLGIPARIVSGFSQGRYDPQKKLWLVDGSDAHSWVQIYFPGFGWMNFDPTPSFSVNGSGTHTTSAPTPVPTKTATGRQPTATPRLGSTPGAQPTATAQHQVGPSTPTAPTGDTGVDTNLFLLVACLALLVSCAVLAFAVARYKKVRPRQPPSVASIYLRLCRVARLAGAPPARWQTPYEYAFSLSRRFPQAAVALRRLTDLFVRERWSGPRQEPAPGEKMEAARLWPGLRNTILRTLVLKKK